MKKFMVFAIAFLIFSGGLLLTVGTVYSKPAVKSWEIPSLVFRTGAYAGFSKIIEWTINKAIEDINSAGGVQGIPLKVKYYDTALDPAKAVAEMSKVVKDAMVIWGPIGANEVNAAFPMAIRNKVLAISPACGYEVSVRYKPWQLHFLPASDLIIPGPMKGWVKKNPDIKKVVQFVLSDDPTFVDHANAQREALEDAGIKVLRDVECPAGVDMGSAVIKGMSGKPGGYVLTVGPAEAGKIILELDKRGIKEKRRIMVYNTADSPALYEIAGKKLNGAYHYSATFLSADNESWINFSKQFKEKFNMEPTWGQPIFYNMVMLTAKALSLETITGDPKKLAEERIIIRNFMRNYKGFKGIVGDFDIVDGIAMTASNLYQYQDGKKIFIEKYIINEDE